MDLVEIQNPFRPISLTILAKYCIKVDNRTVVLRSVYL